MAGEGKWWQVRAIGDRRVHVNCLSGLIDAI